MRKEVGTHFGGQFWLNKELLVKLKYKPDMYGKWKQGQTQRDRESSHSYPGMQSGWPDFGVLEISGEGWEQQE